MRRAEGLPRRRTAPVGSPRAEEGQLLPVPRKRKRRAGSGALPASGPGCTIRGKTPWPWREPGDADSSPARSRRCPGWTGERNRSSHGDRPAATTRSRSSPGAIIETAGRYYMYCMAGMEGDQEGSSRRTIAVAESADLANWRVHPSPVLSHVDAPGDNIYVNGAVVTPEGRIVIMYAVQQYPAWLGFMIASADGRWVPSRPMPGIPCTGISMRPPTNSTWCAWIIRITGTSCATRVTRRGHREAGRGETGATCSTATISWTGARTGQPGVRSRNVGRLGCRACPSEVPEPHRRHVVSLVRAGATRGRRRARPGGSSGAIRWASPVRRT